MISDTVDFKTPFGGFSVNGGYKAQVGPRGVPDYLSEASFGENAQCLSVHNRYLAHDDTGAKAHFYLEIFPAQNTIVTVEDSTALLALKLKKGDETAWIAVNKMNWQDQRMNHVTVEDISRSGNKFDIVLRHPSNCVIMGLNINYVYAPSNNPNEIPQWISDFSNPG